MSVIKIVRLERRGFGIFRPKNQAILKSKIAQRTYDRHNNGGFPMPWQEDLDMDMDGKEWFCAYKTVEQLQQWVLKEELAFFISKGFKVLLLSVSEYQEGEKQVIFTKESIVSSEDITTLFV